MTLTPIPERPQPARFATVDLDRVPQVQHLLDRLGLGRYDRSTVVTLPGRNDTWAGPTTTGAAVFVKRLTGPKEDVRQRLDRALTFERFSDHAPAGHLRGPRLLGHDADAGLMAFEYLADARGGDILTGTGPEAADTAWKTGGALARLHGTAAPSGGAGLEHRPPALPSDFLLRGLPLPMYERASGAELQAWHLLQNDPAVLDAIDSLLDAERTAPRGPAHCDLRLDQLLITPGSPTGALAADWEEFRLADPARDVGSLAGEFLYRSVMDIVSPGAPDLPSNGSDGTDREQFPDTTLTRGDVLRRGAGALARLRPVVRAFWSGYRAERPDADPRLAERATAFAGWHTIDRLLAAAARRNRLLGIERAAAGIGRTALLEPARFAPVIGLGGQG
ncbi:class V lanthionine synthetase subunit LxmK [Kitasatospora sp. NPDC050463]|uniref:class V lanthionine synthetase subunit LxmK n=1 Tax=Kitasatospora sp. NPDC050463 TaxID=3155786 RepID=UPI0033E38E22